MDEKDALAMFSALSQETRLNVVRYLVQCGKDGAPAGDVGAKVGATSSRASFHLSALEQAGLVTSERKSRQIIYTANFQALGTLVSFILNDCCGSNPDVLACCALGKDCC